MMTATPCPPFRMEIGFGSERPSAGKTLQKCSRLGLTLFQWAQRANTLTWRPCLGHVSRLSPH